MGICKFFKYIIYQHVQYPQIARNWGIFTEFKGCCKGVWSCWGCDFTEFVEMVCLNLRQDWISGVQFTIVMQNTIAVQSHILIYWCERPCSKGSWFWIFLGSISFLCHRRENLTVCQVDFPWLFGNKNFRGRFLSPLNICVGKHNP